MKTKYEGSVHRFPGMYYFKAYIPKVVFKGLKLVEGDLILWKDVGEDENGHRIYHVSRKVEYTRLTDF